MRCRHRLLLLLALVASAHSGRRSADGQPIKPGTGDIPLTVWVVLGEGEEIGGDGNWGCRLSAAEIEAYIDGLKRTAPEAYGPANFQWDLVELRELRDPGLSPTPFASRTWRPVEQFVTDVVGQAWEQDTVNIYFCGNVQEAAREENGGFTRDPRAALGRTVELPWILINDGGGDEPSGSRVFVAAHLLEHEMCHYLGRFDGRTFGVREYDAEEHVPDAENTLLKANGPYPLFVPGPQEAGTDRKAGQDAAPPGREDAIALLEAAADRTPAEALEAAEVVARATAPGDYATWMRIRPLLESESLDPRARGVLFEAFIDNADVRIAEEMLSMALAWSATNQRELIETDLATRPEVWGQWSSVILLRAFFERLSAPPLRELIGSSDGAMQLLREVALGSCLWSSYGPAAILTLRDSPVSAERRAEVAADIIAADSRSMSPHPVLLSLLRPSQLPRLRALVAQSGGSRETLHWSALAALAHLGDEQSRELIKAKVAELARGEPLPQDPAQYYLWKIDIQHPPEQLLDFIAEPEGRFHAHGHLFAIRRAAELGLPGDRIREAILRHAENEPVQRRRDAKGRLVTWRSGLGTIKLLGLELGILREGDLPDVRDPTAGIHH